MSYWWINSTLFPYAHADHHFIAFHPNYNGSSETRFYDANDGGVTVTSNPSATKGTSANDICPNTVGQLKGATYGSLNNGYQVTQYYDGAVYPDGSTFFGGAQDNGTTKGTTAGGPATWTSILGGDGGYVAVDSSNTNIQYGEFTGISIYKSTTGGGSGTFSASTTGISDARGGQFINPFTIDPNTPATLWTSGGQLWRTTNNATSWTAASTPTMLNHNSACAVSASATEQFTSHAVATGNSNRVLAGTDCGYIYRNTAALSATSATVWSSAQPATGYVDAIAFDPNNQLIAYAVYGTFGVGHIWKTTDGGATWTNISGSGGTALPDAPAHTVVVDPDNGSKIYVGTDLGVYVTSDGGATWARENTGFANVSTERLLIRKSGAVKEIYAFTHGRAAWKADISNALITTTTTVVSSANPSVVGQNVTFTATVSGSPGTPTGTVTFKDGAGTLGSSALAAGSATFSTSSLTLGSHSITAVYSGDATFATSTSSVLTQVVNQAATTAAISSDTPDPSVTGQAVTVSASVTVTAPGSGTPTGTISVTAPGSGGCSIALPATSCALTFTAAGATTISAQYTGNANFAASNTATAAHQVNKADTSTGLGLSTSTSVFGQSVTLTATVTATAPGAGTASGTVTFFDGATTLGSGTLSGGVATLSVSTLAVGSHPNLTASYGGDANFNTSVSSAQSLTVSKAGTGSALGVAPASSSFGQMVTLTATITATAPGAGTPTGTVTFFDGASSLGTGTLNASGVATLSKSNFTVGTHATLTAQYGGDGNFNASTSSAQSLTVGPAGSSTALNVSPSSASFGQTVTLTATVTSAAGTPTGTVTFFDGAVSLGTGTLNASGVATLSKSNFTVGSHATLTAQYAGDGTFSGSTSSAQSLTVSLAASSTTLSLSATSVTAGTSVTLTATVSGGVGTPTGTVTFLDGPSTLGTGTLDASGVATFSTAAFSIGSHSLTASYGGSAVYAGSTSTAKTLDVTGGVDLSVTIGNGLSYLITGTTVTYTLDVANAGPLTATGALLSNGVAAGLTGMTWTCATLSGASCPSASGSGAISEFVTLAAGQSLRYTITATVNGAAGDTVINTAGVEANNGDFELNAADNSATDSDLVRAVPLFSDGYE
ncbi:MAG: Ig-like domain repeat protein [Gemmataceae bacterium]